jgi:TRAP-type transport system small permease protein
MTFAKINKRSETVLYWSTALATTGFIVFVLVGVITRYLTKTPILSSVELSRLFFVWACFLAATLAYRRRAHIAITFITDKLPAKVDHWIGIVVLGLTIIFFSAVTWESIRVVALLWHTHLPVSGISQSWFYVPVPVASLVIILFSLEELVQLIPLIQKI